MDTGNAMEMNYHAGDVPVVNGQPLVGQPVVVAQPFLGCPTDFKYGMFHNPVVAEQYMAYGAWSDSMTDCDMTANSFLACCCPCVLLFQVMEKVGTVPAPHPIRTLKASQVLFAYMIVFGVGFLFHDVGPKYHCVKVPIHHGQHHHHHPWPEVGFLRADRQQQQAESEDRPRGFDRRLVEGDLQPFPGGAEDQNGHKKYKTKCQSVVGLVTEILLWVIVFLACKGIREKLRINEEDSVTGAKSCCCMEICLCLQPCYLAQISRHVDRVLGWTPPTMTTHHAVPSAPGGI